MNRLAHGLILTLLLMMAVGSLKSQDLIQGLVLDTDSGLPIAHVQITESRNSRSTISDSLGRFSLEIKKFPTILNLSHLSYELKHSLLQKKPKGLVRISLSPRLIKIDEVFILGNKIQHFFKKDLFSIKDYVIIKNRIWTLGYSNNNSMDLEIRVLKLSGDLIAKKKVRNGSDLFLDAFGNVHQVQKDSVKQLYLENDSIFVFASIIKKEEREIFLNLVAHFDSLAIIQRVNPVGTYN